MADRDFSPVNQGACPPTTFNFKNVGIGAQTLSRSNRSIASYEEMKGVHHGHGAG
jgi:hypothetical protein